MTTTTGEGMCAFSAPTFFDSTSRTKYLDIHVTPNHDAFGLHVCLPPDFRDKANAHIWAQQCITFCWLQGLRFRTSIIRFLLRRPGSRFDGESTESGVATVTSPTWHLTNVASTSWLWIAFWIKWLELGELNPLPALTGARGHVLVTWGFKMQSAVMEWFLSLWVKLINSDKDGTDTGKDDAHFALVGIILQLAESENPRYFPYPQNEKYDTCYKHN